MSPDSAWAAFLRGINVGGNRKVPMAELAALFGELGVESVRTYIQSGNVVFRGPVAEARRIEAAFPAAAEARFGFPVPITLRSAGDLRELLANNPFLAEGADEKRLHVAFLAEEPAATAVTALDPQRSPPDAFALRGRDVYLDLPTGVGRTRLTNAYLDATLGTRCTLRNWRTVRAMAELTVG